MDTPEPEKTLFSVEPISIQADHHDPLATLATGRECYAVG